MKKLTTSMTVLVMAGAAQVAWATPFSDAVNALSPVGYWQGEGNFDDSTANANHLTPFGTATTTAGPGLPGLPGSAMDFRHPGGQNGAYVDTTSAGNALELGGGTTFTINSWISNDEASGAWGITAVGRQSTWLSGWNYGHSTYRDLPASSMTTGHRAWTVGGLGSPAPEATSDNAWHMVTTTVDLALVGNEATFYIDGVSIGTASLGGAALGGSTAYFVVANNSNPITADWGPSDFNGRIDELAVFDTALSAAQISNLYAAAFISGGPCPEPGIIASTNVVVDDVLGTSFSSVLNATYRLQSTPDLVSSNFSDTGAIAIGNGGDMTLFDPTGPSTSKNYRVTQE